MALVLIMASACGSNSGDGAGAGAAGTGAPPSCDSLDAAVSAEEAAQTPRERPDLEDLAIAMDGGAVADPARYGRLVEDAAAIRQLAPELPPIGYSPSAGHDQLTLLVDEPAHEAMVAGAYSAWDCLNERYGVETEIHEGSRHSNLRFVDLHFTGAFNLDLVAADYLALPGVERTSRSPSIGADAFCAADLGGGALRYFLLYGAGDCTAGCTELRAYGFESTAPGTIARLGEWSTGSENPVPVWLELPSYCL